MSIFHNFLLSMFWINYQQIFGSFSIHHLTQLVSDEVQTGEERDVELFVLHAAWDSGDAARQRGFWAAEWGENTCSAPDTHTHTHTFIPPVCSHGWMILSAPVCVQLKYKAALKTGRSSSLYHLLPETLETAHAKEVSELLSEVTEFTLRSQESRFHRWPPPSSWGTKNLLFSGEV